MMKRVLIIEDDPDIISLLEIHLTDLGCEVLKEKDGKLGFLRARNGQYDLIILDVMLPNMDGLSILKQLRLDDKKTPILMLTAKSEEIDKVLGLEFGADDYLTKPFGIKEFIARVKAIFRRVDLQTEKVAAANQGAVAYKNLQIDIDKRKVIINGNRVELTPKEFDLLVLLALNPGRSYSRSEILNQVWGYDFEGYEHTVNSHINRLRIKIEPDVANPQFILTTWGVGYRFSDQLQNS